MAESQPSAAPVAGGSAIQSATGPAQRSPAQRTSAAISAAHEGAERRGGPEGARVPVRALDGVGHDLAGASGLHLADGGLDRRVIRRGEEPLEWQGVAPPGARAPDGGPGRCRADEV